MLSRFTLIVKLITFIVKIITFIFFFSQNTFANNEITIKDFDGQIDDVIQNYHYDHNKTSLYYLNSSLKLNIIDFKSNKVNIIQLSTTDDFISKILI